MIVPLQSDAPRVRTDDHGTGHELPPSPGHGGGGGPDGEPHPNDHQEKLRRYRLAVLIVFAMVAMFFFALSLAMVLRRSTVNPDPSTGKMARDWRAVPLPPILWLNTLVLGLSSLALETGRRRTFRLVKIAPALSIPGVAGRPRHPNWPVLAGGFLGILFLAGQWLAWSQLQGKGLLMALNPGNSFFYILTGAHAVHLVAGLFGSGYAGMLSLFRAGIEREAIVLDAVAWYWHFMGVLWLYLFLLLQWAR